MKAELDVKTIRFRQILHWLKVEKGVKRQEDLAAAIDVNINTISRANSGKRLPTDDLLLTIKYKFEMPQSLEWLRADDLQPAKPKSSIHPDIIETPKVNEQQSLIIELYAQLIKEVENIRRDLSAELDALRYERQQLSALTRQLRHTVGVPYSETEDSISIAAEPKTTQL